ALAVVPGDAAERDAVVERAIVPDLRGLADHDTHAVVDEDAAADDGAGVDLDAREEARHVRREAREPAQSPAPVRVGDAVQLQRMEAGITREHLPDGPGGGIALEDALDVLTDAAEHGGRIAGWPVDEVSHSRVKLSTIPRT